MTQVEQNKKEILAALYPRGLRNEKDLASLGDMTVTEVNAALKTLKGQGYVEEGKRGGWRITANGKVYTRTWLSQT